MFFQTNFKHITYICTSYVRHTYVYATQMFNVVYMLTYFRGAEKEPEDDNGRTPLLMAAAYGKTEAVIKLLEMVLMWKQLIITTKMLFTSLSSRVMLVCLR